MTFLQPWWLLLAAAAIVPVLIHLLRRQIGSRVELPTARYLARAEAEHSRELRVRNLLLMILRAAAIALFAIAAARPLVPLGPGSAAPNALAVVLDNSMSTAAVVRGAPTLDVLRSAAARILAHTRPQDRLWLVTIDGTVYSAGRAELETLLADLVPIAGRGDPARAVRLAAAAVRGSGLPGQVAILTDGQATQWSEPVSASGARLVVFAPAAEPPPNGAVVETRADPLRWSGASGAVNVGFLAADTILYRIVLDGRTVLRGIAEPDGSVRVRLTAGQTGWIAGIAETERDELPIDDVRHFAVFSGEPPRVLANGAGAYATAAVATLVDRGRLRTGPDIQVAGADLDARLPALLVAPLDPLRAGAANRSLGRLSVPWRLTIPLTDSAAAQADPAVFGGAPPPAVMFRYRLQHIPADASDRIDTLATVAGEPWIVAGANYVLVGSALDPAHTDLPVSAGFLAWLEGTLAHRLTTDARGVIERAPGDTVVVPSWADGVESGETPAAATSRSIGFQHPGVYFLTRGGARVGAIVVNPPRRESLLERLSTDTLRARFAGASSVIATSDARRLEQSITTARGRTDATVTVLALAALLLLTEMVVRSNLLTRRRY